MSREYGLIEKSFMDLYRVYKPENLEKFTDKFLKKYKIPRVYRKQLMELVEQQ